LQPSSWACRSWASPAAWAQRRLGAPRQRFRCSGRSAPCLLLPPGCFRCRFAPAAAPAPVANKGDVAWMIVSTLLVIMMTVPGLALFYGGLVRSKNMLSVLMQVMVTFSLIVVLWMLYGYSLAFTEGNKFIGGLDRLFMKGLFDASAGTFAMGATFSKGVYIPELLFAAFQATFAGITCCLIVGAFAERIKFSAVLLFMALWFTFSYAPIAHMVWFWMGPDAYTRLQSSMR
jgi:Amt family ammonium transporter